MAEKKSLTYTAKMQIAIKTPLLPFLCRLIRQTLMLKQCYG